MRKLDETIGIYFEKSPDDERYLRVEEILEFTDYQNYKWDVTISETHLFKDEQIQNEDLFDASTIMTGTELEKLLKNNDYYSIFLTLRAFSPSCTDEKLMNTAINSLADFTNSLCEFYVTIIDGYIICVLTKDPYLQKRAYHHVNQLGYINTRYIKRSEDWYLE